MTDIISVIPGLLIRDNSVAVESLDTEDVIETIDTFLDYPMEKSKKKLFIPVLHAFFSFLADTKRLPHAQEIAEAVLSEQDSFKQKLDADGKNDAISYLLNTLIKSGVDIEDESELQSFLLNHHQEILRGFLDEMGFEKGIATIEALCDTKQKKSVPARKPVPMSSIPLHCREKYSQITTLTDRFCTDRLDLEYAAICQTIAARCARKKGSPLMRGKTEIRAGGIVYAVAQMNFVFDRSFEPYQSADDICSYFGISKSTPSQKAKFIRDLIGMNNYWDPLYTTEVLMAGNPLNNIRMSREGFLF